MNWRTQMIQNTCYRFERILYTDFPFSCEHSAEPHLRIQPLCFSYSGETMVSLIQLFNCIFGFQLLILRYFSIFGIVFRWTHTLTHTHSLEIYAICWNHLIWMTSTRIKRKAAIICYSFIFFFVIILQCVLKQPLSITINTCDWITTDKSRFNDFLELNELFVWCIIAINLLVIYFCLLSFGMANHWIKDKNKIVDNQNHDKSLLSLFSTAW